MKSAIVVSLLSLATGCVAEDFGLFSELELEILADELGPLDGPMTTEPRRG